MTQSKHGRRLVKQHMFEVSVDGEVKHGILRNLANALPSYSKQSS